MLNRGNVCLFATDVCKVSFSTAANLSELMAEATDQLKSASRMLADRSVFSACSLALNPPGAADANSAPSADVFLSRIWKSAVGNSGSEGEGGVERGGWR